MLMENLVLQESDLMVSIDKEAKQLETILKSGKRRLELLYRSLDSLFGNDSEEGSQHSGRMYSLVTGVAADLGLRRNVDLKLAGYAAILHDIGKSALPHKIMEEIKKKSNYLNNDGYNLMKAHVLTGYMIAEKATRDIIDLRDMAHLILCHHEEMDGLGYLNLKAEEIPKISGIISVVDSYLAVVRKRSYDPATSHENAMNEIKRTSGLPFDVEISRQFNKTKLKNLREQYREVFEDLWKVEYKETLRRMLNRNTRHGVRLSDNLRKRYHKVIQSGSVRALERLYVDIRLSPEQQYSPKVVTAFIKYMDKNPKLVEMVGNQP